VWIVRRHEDSTAHEVSQRRVRKECGSGKDCGSGACPPFSA
jgi:hypothetical protein